MPDVRAVIAIGQQGQFGLNGRLPWEGNREKAFVEDVERFFELTRGHVIILGPRDLRVRAEMGVQGQGLY